MSEFEYASVIVSIVLALGIAEVLRFLADTLRDPRARQIYWVHLLWVILLLELQVEFWWRMWEFKNLVAVGPQLALLLVGPAILFMATRIMLPRPTDNTDMARLYFGHKNAFFATMIVLSFWSLASSTLATQQEPFTLSLISTAVVLAAFVACMVSANRWLHAAVVVAILVMEAAEFAAWALGT